MHTVIAVSLAMTLLSPAASVCFTASNQVPGSAGDELPASASNDLPASASHEGPGSGAGPPFVVRDDAWRPLRACADTTLQRRLEQQLSQRDLWRRLLREAKLSVGLVDLTQLESPRLAQLNGDTMLEVASLAKIAVLLAAHQSLAEGTLEQTPELQGDLRAMIRVSSNEAATRVIQRLGAGRAGLERIATVLTLPRYALFEPRQGGGLWVGAAYPAGRDSLPEPLRGFLHAATATQVCRFYHLLLTGRLVDLEHSRSMLAAMAEPGLQTKFVRALAGRVPPSRLYRKSGSWGRHHADSVLVWGEASKRYIAVAIVEHADGELILQQLLPALEAALNPG